MSFLFQPDGSGKTTFVLMDSMLDNDADERGLKMAPNAEDSADFDTYRQHAAARFLPAALRDAIDNNGDLVLRDEHGNETLRITAAMVHDSVKSMKSGSTPDADHTGDAAATPPKELTLEELAAAAKQSKSTLSNAAAAHSACVAASRNPIADEADQVGSVTLFTPNAPALVMAPGLDPTSMVATTPLFHLAALGVSQLGGFEKLSRVTGKALLEVSLLSSMPPAADN